MFLLHDVPPFSQAVQLPALYGVDQNRGTVRRKQVTPAGFNLRQRAELAGFSVHRRHGEEQHPFGKPAAADLARPLLGFLLQLHHPKRGFRPLFGQKKTCLRILPQQVLKQVVFAHAAGKSVNGFEFTGELKIVFHGHHSLLKLIEPVFIIFLPLSPVVSHLSVVVIAHRRGRVEQRGQQIFLDVADAARVLLKTAKDVLDVHTVDLAHPLLDQFGGILRPGYRDRFPAGAEDFHHQLDDLIHPIPVIWRDKAVIPDLRPHAVPNRRNIFLPFPEMD